MSPHALPHFNPIDLETYVDRLDALLQHNLETIRHLLDTETQFTWDTLMAPLEDMQDTVERFFSPLSHLHAVVNTPNLRACYQACLPKLSAYESAIGQNEALYKAMESLDRSLLDPTQCKILDDALLHFRLSGVALPPEQKRRFETIQTRLSELSNQFENNVLDASQAYQYHVTDPEQLAGLPEHSVATARALAEEKHVAGWLFTLEIPSYLAVLTYADDRDFREQLHKAYITRASDKGPSAEQFDNTTIMEDILALRQEEAELLGFANYAEVSLATKMAESTEQVIDFLTDLCRRSRPQALSEFQALQAFAAEKCQITAMEPWDIAYVSEKKKHASYTISQEALRPYFTVSKVMDGLFSILNTLYGLTIETVPSVDTWHPDVVCYQIFDAKHTTRGYVYVDLFARQNKRGGAWMDALQSRRKLSDGRIQLPIATLTCNFAKPTGHTPATLLHDEVVTLFHEFGHCLHHILTQVDYISVSGTHGVEWDAVELPSQFFENWCWEKEALALLTAHVETGQPLPAELLEKLLAAKNFQSAMAMMRQLEFSLFDFRIHQSPKLPIDATLQSVRQETCVVPIAPYNRFQHSFTHIFSGGYAAGYYSYKWAEVLSSDAFSRFETEGIFNAKTGQDFLHTILEIGGSKKALDAFLDFQGRPPSSEALLRHNGIQS